uniref:PIH1 domain-containing protein 1 n=1 Tax=Drosophila melanogaster TaxID=7227 RepID=Q9VK57_DROME|nr:PIH1 domain containing 1, isoform A [Drosophila melanogaster]AAF53221.1 PIH1 domain containing 1, isoform A [Drosophila melanogaster]AAL28740.1 LD15349p [Drosophila melanogaster]ACL89118.1 CG5792-PA [synthetic construct]|eukprot:NP_609590.1 Pih1D1, isoform A [Drosophila melanogaster]
MSRRSNFIEGNDNFRDQNLRFVRNEFEDNINQYFGGADPEGSGPQQKPPPRDSLIVQPTAGICVKSFKTNSDEKFFINVCQAAEVPAPQDVTEEELIGILESTTPGSYRVPMSISDPRFTKDRSDKTVDVCDIAINPKFLVKIQKSQLFKNFFMQIVIEAMSEKYNVQLNMEKTIILNNRKFIGTLVTHRVRNEDMKRAQSTSGIPAALNSRDGGAVAPENSGKLVQEIDEKDAAAIRKSRQSAGGGFLDIQYKLRGRVRDESVDEIHAEIYLPNYVSSQEFSLLVGEDRIVVETRKYGYVFNKFVNYRLQQDRAQALFDKTTKMLHVRIPVFSN